MTFEIFHKLFIQSLNPANTKPKSHPSKISTKHPDSNFMICYVQSLPYPNLLNYLKSAAVNACTTLVPSLNLVLKMRFAFWNMPSFNDTTIN